MRILGRQISNWWLLVLLPLLFVAAPVLLIGFFAANNLAGAILGPPAIWNRPNNTPSSEDIAGDYVEGKRELEFKMGEPTATLSLHLDGTMAVKGLPFDQYPGFCIISGEGRWRLTNDQVAKVSIDVSTAGAGNSCKPDDYSYIELAGRSKPYKLYWVVGDPDSGTGVWLVKK
jgi:hypothetical protein